MTASPERVLVTGGTGFVGSYVVRDLLAGGAEVLVADLDPDETLLRAVVPAGQPGRLEVECLDITDALSVLRLFGAFRPQAVVHLAAPLTRPSEEQVARSVAVHVQGTAHVLEAAAGYGVRRAVVASSVTVYGDQSRRTDEIIGNGSWQAPESVYAVCKSLVERMLPAYAARGLGCLALRLSAVYGYGKHVTVARGTGGSHQLELVEKPALGVPGRVPHGDALIDWLYVEDAARAFVLALAGVERGGGLNVCGSAATVRDVATIVRSLIPGAMIDVEAGTWPHNLAMRFELSGTEASIGYRPRVTLEEGLQRTIDAVRRASAPV